MTTTTISDRPPATPPATPDSRTAQVAVIKTRPESVVEDYARLMDLARYRETLDPSRDNPPQAQLVVDEVFPSVLVPALAV